MIIYSRWDPSSGLYDYFEGSARPGLNDDLAVPPMPEPTELGVPSTECGRPLPRGAAHVGSGEFAQGLMAAPAGVDLLAGGLPGANGAASTYGWIVLAFVGGALTWALLGDSIKRAWR